MTILLALLLACSCVSGVLEVIESDIGEFKFVSKEEINLNIADVTGSLLIKYANGEDICEARINEYLSKDILLEKAYGDTNLDELTEMSGKKVVKIGNSYGWNKEMYTITIGPEIDWNTRFPKEHSCERIASSYIILFPSEIEEVINRPTIKAMATNFQPIEIREPKIDGVNGRWVYVPTSSSNDESIQVETIEEAEEEIAEHIDRDIRKEATGESETIGYVPERVKVWIPFGEKERTTTTDTTSRTTSTTLKKDLVITTKAENDKESTLVVRIISFFRSMF